MGHIFGQGEPARGLLGVKAAGQLEALCGQPAQFRHVGLGRSPIAQRHPQPTRRRRHRAAQNYSPILRHAGPLK